jgi:hypothetical protein
VQTAMPSFEIFELFFSNCFVRYTSGQTTTVLEKLTIIMKYFVSGDDN